MNIVIWIQGLTPQRGGVELLNPAVKILERLYGKVNALGVIPYKGVGFNEVKNISKEDLKNLDYDLILVTGADNSVLITNTQSNFVKILKEAQSLEIDTDKIILDRVICVPFFTLEKYKKLRHSQLSILSMNCFAGLLYHRFGLPFLSPMINMFTSDEDFIKFLKAPMKNVSAKLKLLRTERNEGLKIDYPVYKIGDTEWEMNHYGDANVAYRKWCERSFRINWFNLLVTMYTEKPEILAEFDKFPYSKKVCFVPFKSDLDSAYFVDVEKYGGELWQVVNGIGTGKVIEYDMWDMLLYGKKTPLIFGK